MQTFDELHFRHFDRRSEAELSKLSFQTLLEFCVCQQSANMTQVNKFLNGFGLQLVSHLVVIPLGGEKVIFAVELVKKLSTLRLRKLGEL